MKTNPIKANLFRIEYCVMRIAERSLKKQSQNRPLAGNPKFEFRNPKQVEKVYLKKQSQYVPEQNGAKSVVKGDYDKMPGSGAEENKAKQSQFHTR